MNRRTLLLIVLLAPVLLPLAAGAQPAEVRYTATDVTTLGGAATGPLHLNDAGDVGGSAYFPMPGGTTQLRPIIYSNGVLTDLGLPAGASEGYVNDLNDRADAAVNYTFDGPVGRPYTYAGGVLVPVELPAGVNGGLAYGINNLGRLVGSGQTVDGFRPFLYRPGVGSTRLDTPGGPVFAPIDVNDRGQVLGRYSTLSGGRLRSHAVVWSNGTTTEIATPAGWLETDPVDINESGDVVGMVRNQPGMDNGVRRPFLYRDGRMTLLDGFGVFADPRAVNDLGEFVGTYLGGLTTHGYLYSDGAYQDIGRMASLPDGFDIYAADDVNNLGQILVRAQNAAGERRTFLLTPVPEPGVVGAIAVAGAWGLLARRRRS